MSVIRIEKKSRSVFSLKKLGKNTKYISGRKLVKNFIGKIYLSTYCLLLILVITSCSNDRRASDFEETKYDLVLYSHQALAPLINKTIPIFEELHGCQLGIQFVDNSMDLVGKITEIINDQQVDIIIGIDNSNLAWAVNSNIAKPYKPKDISIIDDTYHYDNTYQFIPFSYGYYAFVYDSFIIDKPPDSFGRFQDGIWKDQILMSDPRTSSQGLGFLLWSLSLFGENGYGHFWRSMKNNIFFITPLWEQSYSMFLAGEAPFFVGYTTSPAFLNKNYADNRYKSVIPHEGAFMYFEGVGIASNTQNLELSQKFIDFVISSDFQNHIPNTRWLYPVNEKVKLPEIYSEIKIPDNITNDNISRIFRANRVNNWVDRWTQIMID